MCWSFRLLQLRTNHSNTSTAAVLRLSISDERTKKMPKQLIAAAAAIVLCIATTATGTISVARGGGFGGGGHIGGFGGGGHGFGGAGLEGTAPAGSKRNGQARSIETGLEDVGKRQDMADATLVPRDVTPLMFVKTQFTKATLNG
jgi:hypothetical protein